MHGLCTCVMVVPLVVVTQHLALVCVDGHLEQCTCEFLVTTPSAGLNCLFSDSVYQVVVVAGDGFRV